MTSPRARAQAPIRTVIAGVDAHKDTHHVVVLTGLGQRLADRAFPATIAGYADLRDRVGSHGPIRCFAMESTGSYSAALTRYLIGTGADVVEVNRPHPRTRSRVGKDDAIDAEAAARKALSGQCTARPKDTTTAVESIRVLTAARDSAVKAPTQAHAQLRDLLITAPADLRERITATTSAARAAACRRLRPGTSAPDRPAQAVRTALRSIATRISALDEEISALDTRLDALVTATAPTLTSRTGIGTHTAARLLITAGANIERLDGEAAFARLCGTAPVPVSSGRTRRTRLHRGGDRQANKALHQIAVCRLRHDPRTKTYMQRRLDQGLSKKDVLRCLKRYIARQAFKDLTTDLHPTP